MTTIQPNGTQWDTTLNDLTKLCDIMAKVIILQREPYVDTNPRKYTYAITDKHTYASKHGIASKNNMQMSFKYKGNKRANMSRGYKGSKRDARRSIRAY